MTGGGAWRTSARSRRHRPSAPREVNPASNLRPSSGEPYLLPQPDMSSTSALRYTLLISTHVSSQVAHRVTTATRPFLVRVFRGEVNRGTHAPRASLPSAVTFRHTDVRKYLWSRAARLYLSGRYGWVRLRG